MIDHDIFTESDLGSGTESAPTTAAPAAEPEAPAIPDSPAAAEPVAPTEPASADQGAQVQDGTQQEQPIIVEAKEEEGKAEEPTLSDAEKLEQEAEAALADPKTPKWFKNAVEQVYKPKLDELGKQLEAVSQFGTAEEIGQRLELLNGLETIRSNPSTGMPERTTEPFVKSLYEKDPQGAYQLMSDLASLPSPYSQGLTVTQEMFKQIGVDPARLDDIRNFAANGYQMQASAQPAPDPTDLQELPAHLHATFGKLDPETRDSLMVMDQAVRDRTLEAYKNDLERTEREAYENQTREQTEAQAEAQRQAAFKQQVDVKGDENFQQAGESVLNAFVESLAKQAGMSNLDSLAIANTVLNAFEPTLAGRTTLAALKAEGIEVDPAIPGIIAQLEEKSNHIAYYQITGDQAAVSKAVADQVGLQQALLAKSNKIIAAVAQKRNGNVIGKVQEKAAALAQTQNSRHAVAGQGGQVRSEARPTLDYSDEGYLELINADPHFRNG